MRALAGPAMLLVIVGGFTIYKAMSKEDAPSREFTELELAADDEDHTGTCYSLSTVLIANGVFGNATRTWTAPDPDNENKWTLELENVRQDPTVRNTCSRDSPSRSLASRCGSWRWKPPRNCRPTSPRTSTGCSMAPHHRKSTPPTAA